MIYVGDLVNQIKNVSNDVKIKTILPNGEIVEVGCSNYVESEVYYLFKVDKYGTQDILGLKDNLNYEANDECWRVDYINLFDDNAYLSFLDCECRFCNFVVEDWDKTEWEEDEIICDIKDITLKDNILYLNCEKN